MTEKNEIHRVPAPPSLFFRGRPGDPRLGGWVKPIDTLAEIVVPKGKIAIVLFGCPDDSGIKNNRGRLGAKEGPDSVRKHLYKMCPPCNLPWEKQIDLYDWGNIVPDENILETHRRAMTLAQEIAAHGYVGIALGGGHDFAAPHFAGFASGVSSRKKKPPGSTSVALTNVDPHLDMRPTEEGIPNSGTPFRQLLDAGILKGRYFLEFGIRANRNARSHYQYAKEKKVSVLFYEDLKAATHPMWKQYKNRLNQLSRQVPQVMTTFCMDACAETEGTSAAPVIGFTAWEMASMAESAGREKKVGFFEIAEVSPILDATERSSRLAAEMIYFFLKGRARISRT